MGWTVLYIAFGVVALWLLGEVLLQYKARLRWRLLAFVGFMGVVLGVLMSSIAVIAIGAVAFAAGQTLVTLSFRRGFSTGWAIGGSPGASRRRKLGRETPAEREPALEVSDLEYEGPAADPETTAVHAPETTAVYEPEPMPEDTGSYGVYRDAETAHQASGTDQAGGYGEGYQAYPGYEQQPAGDGAYAAHGTYQGHEGYASQHAYGSHEPYAPQGIDPGATGYPGQDPYAVPYDYGTGQQQYAAYGDPYGDAANGAGQYGSHNEQQQQAGAYAQPYDTETPPGGVWVPQPRESAQTSQIPQDPSQQYGYDAGYNDQQYRY